MGALEISDDWCECICSECRKSDKLKALMKSHFDNVGPTNEFDDDQYVICPPRFLGYGMQRKKKWIQMPANGVQEYKDKIKTNAFEKLILEQNQKELIKSLVANHEKKKLRRDGKRAGADDWIEGKGGGLVILLHGPPGVGKTSATESVARATNKPLFTVSVSDIGLVPQKVEGNLEKVFILAARWEAVLLFDKAAVFLEAREMDKGDLNRNSLVTGFLRILEYYDGILILTTNPTLQTPELRKLFMRFLEERGSEIANYRELENWVQEDFDEGIDERQIRNIVSSAMALAKNEDNPDGKLRLPHIKRVLKMSTQFHNSWYLKVRYGAIFGD
ncbi:P-loop containing nucleoside triphosphate hydrolase protein [Aspergillus insuetus]